MQLMTTILYGKLCSQVRQPSNLNGRVERYNFYNSYHDIYLGILQLLVSWQIEVVNKKV